MQPPQERDPQRLAAVPARPPTEKYSRNPLSRLLSPEPNDSAVAPPPTTISAPQTLQQMHAPAIHHAHVMHQVPHPQLQPYPRVDEPSGYHHQQMAQVAIEDFHHHAQTPVPQQHSAAAISAPPPAEGMPQHNVYRTAHVQPTHHPLPQTNPISSSQNAAQFTTQAPPVTQAAHVEQHHPLGLLVSVAAKDTLHAGPAQLLQPHHMSNPYSFSSKLAPPVPHHSHHQVYPVANPHEGASHQSFTVFPQPQILPTMAATHTDHFHSLPQQPGQPENVATHTHGLQHATQQQHDLPVRPTASSAAGPGGPAGMTQQPSSLPTTQTHERNQRPVSVAEADPGTTDKQISSATLPRSVTPRTSPEPTSEPAKPAVAAPVAQIEPTTALKHASGPIDTQALSLLTEASSAVSAQASAVAVNRAGAEPVLPGPKKAAQRNLEGDASASAAAAVTREQRTPPAHKQESPRTPKRKHAGRKEILDDEKSEPAEVTRCPCGSAENFGFMISCETCHDWQHGRCMGYRRPSETPDLYYCEKCRPDLIRVSSIAHPKFKERQAAKESKGNQVVGKSSSVNGEQASALSTVKPLELRRQFAADIKSRDEGHLSTADLCFSKYGKMLRNQFGKDRESVVVGLMVLSRLKRPEVVQRLDAALADLKKGKGGTSNSPGASTASGRKVSTGHALSLPASLPNTCNPNDMDMDESSVSSGSVKPAEAGVGRNGVHKKKDSLAAGEADQSLSSREDRKMRQLMKRIKKMEEQGQRTRRKPDSNDLTNQEGEESKSSGGSPEVAKAVCCDGPTTPKSTTLLQAKISPDLTTLQDSPRENNIIPAPVRPAAPAICRIGEGHRSRNDKQDLEVAPNSVYASKKRERAKRSLGITHLAPLPAVGPSILRKSTVMSEVEDEAVAGALLKKICHRTCIDFEPMDEESVSFEIPVRKKDVRETVVSMPLPVDAIPPVQTEVSAVPQTETVQRSERPERQNDCQTDRDEQDDEDMEDLVFGVYPDDADEEDQDCDEGQPRDSALDGSQVNIVQSGSGSSDGSPRANSSESSHEESSDSEQTCMVLTAQGTETVIGRDQVENEMSESPHFCKGLFDISATDFLHARLRKFLTEQESLPESVVGLE